MNLMKTMKKNKKKNKIYIRNNETRKENLYLNSLSNFR